MASTSMLVLANCKDLLIWQGERCKRDIRKRCRIQRGAFTVKSGVAHRLKYAEQ